MKKQFPKSVVFLLFITTLFFYSCETDKETEPNISYQLLGINGTVRVFYLSGEAAQYANVTGQPEGGIIYGGNTGSNGIANLNLSHIISSTSSINNFPQWVKINAVCTQNTNLQGSRQVNVVYNKTDEQGNLHIYRGEFSADITLQ